MDPSEDIIDVLYRFREDPTANQSHHRRGTPTHRFFQRHDSVDGANLTETKWKEDILGLGWQAGFCGQ